jgi:uncharacterized protein
MGLLRLLTASTVMGPGDVQTQQEAWRAYDRWIEDDRIEGLHEPAELGRHFRGLTRSPHVAPKDWADSYLGAFALASRLTIVSFDQAFQNKTKD